MDKVATLYYRKPLTSWVKWSLLFIGLNIADVLLTQMLLSKGGVEAWFWASAWNSNIGMRLLLCLMIIGIIYLINKIMVLKISSILFVGVVIINMVSLGAFYYGYYAIGI